MATNLLERIFQQPDKDAPPPPLGGTRSEAAHRLQIGLSGIAAMVLLVALADTILSRAEQTEASAVPEAAATVKPSETAVPQNDPLAEAGVVPDLPASPTSTPSQEPAILPEQGGGSGED